MKRAILLDTNVILDAAVEGRPQRLAAQLLFDEIAYTASLRACIAATSLKDVYYILTKSGSEAEARKQVADLMKLVDVIAVDEDVCKQALFSDEPDFGDGIVRECAEREGVDYIISRDERAFRRSSVRRLSAQEYVDLFCDVVELRFPQ